MSDVLPIGAKDLPDKRDYIAEQILGIDDIPLPDEVRLELDEGDQGTSVMCTCFSAYHAAQVANEMEHNTSLDPLFDKGWELQGKFGTHTPAGDYVQTALKSIVKNGLITSDGVYMIDGYSQIDNTDINYWLAQGHAIVTFAPVTKTNFKKAKYDGVWSGLDGDKVGGHAFILSGYKPFYKIASNSYGSDWGKFNDGTFLIKNEDVKDLGTSYILYDRRDLKFIFKDVTEESPFAEAIRSMKDEGIMNGYEDGTFGPNRPITRAEQAQVIQNLIKFFNK